MIPLILFLTFNILSQATSRSCEVKIRNLSRTILLDGKLQPFQSNEINAPFEGNIINILEDGVSVKKGQVLFELDTFKVKRDLERAKLEYFLKEQELAQTQLITENEALNDLIAINELQTDLLIKDKVLTQKKFSRNPIELLRMQLQTEKTSQMIDFYKEHLKELEKLGKQGALSITELADERLKFDEYMVTLEQLKLDYENLKDGNPLDISKAQRSFDAARIKLDHSKQELKEKEEIRKSNLEVKRDELNELRVKMEDLESRLSNSAVTATTDGIFLINSHWIGSGYETYRSGHHIKSGAELGQISAFGKLTAHFNIYEIDIGLVKVGQNVKFKVLPLGDQWFRGKISKIHSVLRPKPRQKDDLYRLKIVKVEMKVLDVIPEMKPKMTILAKVEILNTEALAAETDCIENQTVQTLNGIQNLTVGRSGDKYTEILDGLKTGDQIICATSNRSAPTHYSRNARANIQSFFTSIEGTGQLIAKDKTLLTPAFNASIKKILNSGSQVKKGDILVLLDSQNIDTELQSKEIELTQRQVEFKTEELKASQELLTLENEIQDLSLQLEVESKQIQILSTGETHLEILKQELQNKKSEIEQKFQILNFDIQKSLKQNGYLKSTEYQKSFEQLKDAEIDKKLAELELSLKKSPASKTEYSKQQARISNLQLKIKHKSSQFRNKKKLQSIKVDLAKLKLKLSEFDVEILKEKLSMAEIRADRDGTFIPGEHYSQSTIVPYKLGDNVGPGAIVGKLIQFNGFVIEGKIDESNFHYLRRGQSVEFFLTGRTNQRYSGTVIHIAPIPRREGLWWVKRKSPTLNVIIDVQAQSKSFQPGSTVQYEVKVSPERKVTTIPFEAVYQENENYYVYTQKGVKRAVKLGERQQNKVEIIDGLKPDTTVFWDGI